MSHRRVLIVVERRADYSRFRPVIKALQVDPIFDVYVVVTGLCLLESHGLDVRYIQDDGANIFCEIQMYVEDAPDTPGEMVRATGRVLIEISRVLEDLQPDIVLSGFDIGANFAVTVAAAHMNIPVAHIQGGEVSGSIDESLRHAMSKFAHLHFPATEDARMRLIRMGEDPRHIYVVGCPSIDEFVKTPWLSDEKIAAEFGLDLSRPLILMIQHPVTTEALDSVRQIQETLEAIAEVGEPTIALLPNRDTGYSVIFERVRAANVQTYASLPTLQFINLYRRVSVLIGNSSSGIHEAATLGIPVVNVGTRQQGRLRPGNVLDVDYDREAIAAALCKSLYDEEFRAYVRQIKNPYGDGNSAEKIVAVLREEKLPHSLIQKRFYDASSGELTMLPSVVGT